MIKDFSIETLWHDVNFIPNESQEKAIRHIEGPLFITAGPGSGKTRVLLWRTINLVVFHNIDPKEIFLTTFTKKAAHQLKEGLQSYFGMASNYTGKQYDLASMYIGTIHSNCQRLLGDRNFTKGRKRNDAIKVLDQIEQYFFLKKTRIWERLLQAGGIDDLAINAHFQVSSPRFPSKHKAIIECTKLFNRFSEERLDITDALTTLDPDETLHKLVLMYQEYQECLKDCEDVELCDLSFIQEKAVQMVEKTPTASSVFKYLIIDEYQDTNFVQEQLFFKLAGNKNICVVGDDDQALYRFRGSTVENFVEFPSRVTSYLNVGTTIIPLSINYRSRKQIVDFYSSFIQKENWLKNEDPNEQYRVHNKEISAFSEDDGPAIVTTEIDNWITNIAEFTALLINEKRVDDPNQIAFLFPSVKNTYAQQTIRALREVGLNVFAPRAGNFIEGNEASEIFGLFMHIFELPPSGTFSGYEFNKYRAWTRSASNVAQELITQDENLSRFVYSKNSEIKQSITDYNSLIKVIETEKWDLDDDYDINKMRRKLSSATKLSEKAKKAILSKYLDQVVKEKQESPNETPFKLSNIVNRATSLDWSILDLFYQISGFEHFKNYYDLASAGDEAPVCNLSKITEYLAKFMDMYSPILSANFLNEMGFSRLFFSSYLYTLHRFGESEFENEENPFPKGNIPVLTVHQAKGLEFPIVFLYPSRMSSRPSPVEVAIRTLKNNDGEPLDRIGSFDLMRLYYVGLSRAESLLILPNITVQRYVSRPLMETLNETTYPLIENFELDNLPEIQESVEKQISKPYSYTADYLAYMRCPRQYMIFRKYRFIPSRSQTMFFGSLVHNTIEDLHNELIERRSK